MKEEKKIMLLQDSSSKNSSKIDFVIKEITNDKIDNNILLELKKVIYSDYSLSNKYNIQNKKKFIENLENFFQIFPTSDYSFCNKEYYILQQIQSYVEEEKNNIFLKIKDCFDNKIFYQGNEKMLLFQLLTYITLFLDNFIVSDSERIIIAQKIQGEVIAFVTY